MLRAGAVGKKIDALLAAEPADLRFVRAAMIDTVGRSPLRAEYQRARGKTRGDFLNELGQSREFFQGLYERELFYFLLVDQFRPSTPAFERIPDWMAAGRLSIKDMLRQLVSSQYFNQRNPGNDTFVTVLLEQLLGITVQKDTANLEAGKEMYDGQKARFLGETGNSQSDLVRIVMEDNRLEPTLLQRHYESIFGRPMPHRQLRADARSLRDDPGSFPRLFVGWLKSQDYEDLVETLRAKNDQVFVRSLFVDLFGREANYQELRRCRNALLALSDSRPLRSVMIKFMLDSGEVKDVLSHQDPAAQIEAWFRRFLCRQPAEDETRLFAQEWQRGVAPKTMLRAILTHWEYHHY